MVYVMFFVDHIMSWPIRQGYYDKLGIGCSPSRSTSSYRTSLPGSTTSKDNLNEVKVDTNIGKLFVTPQSSVPSDGCETPLETSTPSPVGQPPQSPTFGRKRHQSPEHVLSWGERLSNATMPDTGKKYGIKQKVERSKKLTLVYEFRIIVLCERLREILLNRLAWNELSMYFTVEVAQVSRGELGKKQDHLLILKIHRPSFGVATVVKKMLLSMNLEEESRYHTYFDGWIDTRSSWKLREHQCLCAHFDCGSPPMSTPVTGMRI